MGNPAEPRYKDWLVQLREGDAPARVWAARWLAGEPPLPGYAAGPLLEALFDDTYDHEDWVDWNGGVVGGSDHYVRDYALEALVKMGTAGLKALLEARRRRPAALDAALIQVAAGALPDALHEAGPAARSELLAALEASGTGSGSEAARRTGLANLEWVEREAAAGGERIAVLIARLGHPLNLAQRHAAGELGRTEPKARAAAALADALLGPEPKLDYLAAGVAGASLATLGPVLDDERVGKLVRACLAGELFGVWGSLLASLPGHGKPARELRPMLVAWAADGKPPRQIGADYEREVRAAARFGSQRLAQLCPQDE